MKTSLAKRMIARADRDGLPEDHAMRRIAQEFDEICVKYAMGKSTPKEALGAWDRARSCWCNYTGEPRV